RTQRTVSPTRQCGREVVRRRTQDSLVHRGSLSGLHTKGATPMRKARPIRGRLAVIALALVLCTVWAAAEEPVTITFFFRGGELQSQLVERWISEFERENPDIRVEWHVAQSISQLPVLIAA